MKGHLSKKKSAWEGCRLGRIFVDQRLMRNVETRLKTEILVEKYPEGRLKALDGELTKARRREVLSSETGDK